MAKEIRFTVEDLLARNNNLLERRLRNYLGRDEKMYERFRSHLQTAIGYARDGMFADTEHVYLKPDGIYVHGKDSSKKGGRITLVKMG